MNSPAPSPPPSTIATATSSPDATPASKSTVTKEPFDLLVIGGGIVGAGVIRDAAMRGLNAGLIEQHDFAYGTSSRSSRLLHGGIRYLAQGRIPLVREASREKKILHHIAPHLAEPLAFVFPTYKGSIWKRWKLSIGVKLYDLLCGGANLGPSDTLNTRELLKLVPGLIPDKLNGGVRYYDAKTQDARLVIDTLTSAEKSGAQLLNYHRLESSEFKEGLWYAVVHDRLNDQRITLTARTLVNATGPWSADIPNSQTSIRPTKGVHLVVDRDRLPITDALVMPEGKRILFAIPWNERTYIGTTDTDFEGPPEDVSFTAEDISYILEVTNRYFPDAKLARPDVLSAWAGLRPLVAKKDGNPSDISRKHEITLNHRGWMDITGGKLTTYRLMGEQAVDQLLHYLKIDDPGCTTAKRPLLEEAEPLKFSRISPCDLSKEAVEYYVQHEWAQHLTDLMIRRSGWHYYLHDQENTARQVAQWMAERLDWSQERQKAELDAYLSVPVA